MKNVLLRSLWLALGLSAPFVFAQQMAEDLKFPDKPSEFSFFRGPQLSLYKPEGAGPFPALVLVHQCGGLGVGRSKPNASMLNWAKESVARGYVVLLMDSLGPRGVDTVCYGPKGGVNPFRGVTDALQAAQHLQKFDFVDKNRIALAGFSWGALVGLLASSADYSSKLVPGVRFSAVVSFYPGCFTKNLKGEPFANPFIRSDIDRPLLVLMGELDNETPPAECVEQLSPLKAAGAPVDWHVYPKTTHSWDAKQNDGNTQIDVRGNRVTYRYSKEVTEDSARRMFQFLDKVMNARP
ncbi:MAG: dienelactone hydrolase family protein [Burkholderiales bacterium]